MDQLHKTMIYYEFNKRFDSYVDTYFDFFLRRRGCVYFFK